MIRHVQGLHLCACMCACHELHVFINNMFIIINYSNHCDDQCYKTNAQLDVASSLLYNYT